MHTNVCSLTVKLVYFACWALINVRSKCGRIRRRSSRHKSSSIECASPTGHCLVSHKSRWFVAEKSSIEIHWTKIGWTLLETLAICNFIQIICFLFGPFRPRMRWCSFIQFIAFKFHHSFINCTRIHFRPIYRQKIPRIFELWACLDSEFRRTHNTTWPSIKVNLCLQQTSISWRLSRKKLELNDVNRLYYVSLRKRAQSWWPTVLCLMVFLFCCCRYLGVFRVRCIFHRRTGAANRMAPKTSEPQPHSRMQRTLRRTIRFLSSCKSSDVWNLLRASSD